MEHTTHAAIKGAKRYSNTQPSRPVSFSFYGWVNQLPHDSIAAPGASNPWPFGNESYALTNSVITARSIQSYRQLESIHGDNSVYDITYLDLIYYCSGRPSINFLIFYLWSEICCSICSMNYPGIRQYYLRHMSLDYRNFWIIETYIY
jgi:hypothetical protein